MPDSFRFYPEISLQLHVQRSRHEIRSSNSLVLLRCFLSQNGVHSQAADAKIQRNMTIRALIRVGYLLVLLLPVVLLLPGLVFGQGERATITGTVTDASKSAIPDANVVLRNVATNVTTRTTTNSAGLYFITSIPPGTYELTVDKTGFRTQRVQSIPLTTGLAATQDVILDVGSVQQAVEVSATAVQLESQSSDLNTVVTTRAVSELPILGRDPLSFSALAPGVIPTQGQQGNAGVIGRVTTSQIGGGLAQQNGVLIDGAESRGTTESGNAYSVPVEAVAEFKLETSSYNAQYGRSSGGVAILATKSGTNTIHATAWEFLRNDHLNANSWQNNRNGISKTLFQRNAFGGNIGGPVVIPKLYHGKDKTFFFFNYEGTRQASPDQVLDTVPTAMQRAGDFSQTFDRNGQAGRHLRPADDSA